MSTIDKKSISTTSGQLAASTANRIKSNVFFENDFKKSCFLPPLSVQNPSPTSLLSPSSSFRSSISGGGGGGGNDDGENNDNLPFRFGNVRGLGNLTVQVGSTAYLHCPVVNLGEREVSKYMCENLELQL